MTTAIAPDVTVKTNKGYCLSKKRKKLDISPIEQTTQQPVCTTQNIRYNFSFLNEHQKQAWDTIDKNEITFLLGSAGCGKTYVSTAYAANSILKKQTRKFILTRPMVTTESIGYLPGTADDKIHPFLIPILDSLDDICGRDGQDRKRVNESMEFASLAFMRGRSFNYSIAILDESQNCTIEQIKLFLTRIGKRSKIIVTGDPTQSDLRTTGLMYAVERLSNIEGIGILRMPESSQVRNPIISKIIQKL